MHATSVIQATPQGLTYADYNQKMMIDESVSWSSYRFIAYVKNNLKTSVGKHSPT
jgi:hypothetical protein